MGSQNAHHSAKSLSPSPTITKHHAYISPVHAEDILGSITSGAHYSGALPGRHSDEAPLHPKAWRRRSLNLNVDDPSVQLIFRDVISDLEQLYTGKPSLEIVRRRWREDASLEHPLFQCRNLHEITRLLFAIPRLVKTSEHISTRIISAGIKPNRLIYAQTYVYTLRLFGTRREIKSIVFVDLDEDLKIAQLIDQWNGEEHSASWGAASFRRLFAKIISWTTRVPKHSS
ncbi:hypothetical protein BC628DRAFT_721444 [Trametes gibbosa]|nr:hypothetical protein BC628DRAFT_721444 [Trametes gibbosa]